MDFPSLLSAAEEAVRSGEDPAIFFRSREIRARVEAGEVPPRLLAALDELVRSGASEPSRLSARAYLLAYAKVAQAAAGRA